MPQLMPLNWISSSFMIILILLMIMVMYSLVFCNMLFNKNNLLNICYMNWWW